MKRSLHLAGLGLTVVFLAFQNGRGQTAPAAAAGAAPLKVLIVTGGCCHDYEFQSTAMMAGVSRELAVEWTLVNEGGTGTRAQIALYDDPDWAKPYDVVVHNECFADTADEDYILRITDAHRAGTPAVVIHCAMHTYRSARIDDWREFLGVTSRHHEHQSRYPVKVLREDHPVMAGFPADWTTPMDELYIIDKVEPTATVLATSASERNGAEQPVIWVNDFDGTRVFGTTYGHTNDTFSDPVFLSLIARGIQWAAERPALGPMRTWTSTDGSTIEAALLARDAEGARSRIRRADGEEFVLTDDRLSAADLEYLAGLAAEGEEAAESEE